jgi:hypothetical protein
MKVRLKERVVCYAGTLRTLAMAKVAHQGFRPGRGEDGNYAPPLVPWQVPYLTPWGRGRLGNPVQLWKNEYAPNVLTVAGYSFVIYFTMGLDNVHELGNEVAYGKVRLSH